MRKLVAVALLCVGCESRLHVAVDSKPTAPALTPQPYTCTADVCYWCHPETYQSENTDIFAIGLPNGTTEKKHGDGSKELVATDSVSFWKK